MFRRPAHVPASLAESRLAEVIPMRELHALEHRGTTVRVPGGSEVVREAGVGRECMVVVDGAFAVRRHEDRIAELGAGDFIGEIALLTRQPRNATVTALEDSSVCVFNPREFSSLLDECPAIAAHVRAIAGERSLVA
jgi:CRP-like cAMP-binding protein